MILLSKDTERLIEIIFPSILHSQVIKAITKECSENIPFCENATPENMERIRFSVLKLSEGKMDVLQQAIDMAKLDWRDLFMNAGFGYDTKAHIHWAESMLNATREGLRRR